MLRQLSSLTNKQPLTYLTCHTKIKIKPTKITGKMITYCQANSFFFKICQLKFESFCSYSVKARTVTAVTNTLTPLVTED